MYLKMYLDGVKVGASQLAMRALSGCQLTTNDCQHTVRWQLAKHLRSRAKRMLNSAKQLLRGLGRAPAGHSSSSISSSPQRDVSGFASISGGGSARGALFITGCAAVGLEAWKASPSNVARIATGFVAGSDIVVSSFGNGLARKSPWTNSRCQAGTATLSSSQRLTVSEWTPSKRASDAWVSPKCLRSCRRSLASAGIQQLA